MGSSRLPGKVLMKILGDSILSIELKRAARCRLVDEICVITSTSDEDSQIVQECIRNGFNFFRGSEHDLLDRHYQCALHYKADIILKVPSDCPFMDPYLIDLAISKFKQSEVDYLSNYHPPSFPDGLDVEVFSINALQRAWENAVKPHEREHTTPFIWDNESKFKIGNFANPYGNMFMTHRWCLDYIEDYRFISKVFELLPTIYASYNEILNTVDGMSDELIVNSHLNGVNWYRNSARELRTVGPDLYRHEPNQ